MKKFAITVLSIVGGCVIGTLFVSFLNSKKSYTPLHMETMDE